jgi:putative tricarboxylic transport membrane protein
VAKQQAAGEPSSPTRLPGELVFTALLLALSFFLLWQAYGISGFESLTSAGMFPMLAAATMVVTGVIFLRQTLSRGAADPSEDGGLTAAFLVKITPPVWVGFTLAVCLYMLALPRLGFIGASFVFLLLSMRLLGSRRWLLNLGVSAASLAAIYVVFQTIFSVVLPKGSWLQAIFR